MRIFLHSSYLKSNCIKQHINSCAAGSVTYRDKELLQAYLIRANKIHEAKIDKSKKRNDKFNSKSWRLQFPHSVMDRVNFRSTR